jgi:protein-L-isoaspartate O-methyltransferase
VVVTCGAKEAPRPLFEQLKAGGQIVIPVGEEGKVQTLRVITKGRTASARCGICCPCASCQDGRWLPERACRRLLCQNGDAEAAFQATFRILLHKAVSLGP